MKLPVWIDPDILSVHDADGDLVVSAEIGCSERWHRKQVGDLRRIAAALNLTRRLTTEGMERLEELPLDVILQLSLDVNDVPLPGPLGLVKGA